MFIFIETALIVGLNFVQCYKIGDDCNAYGTLFLRHEGKMIATAMKIGNQYQPFAILLEMPVADKHAGDERKHVVTNRTITFHLIMYQ